ncbi:T9SS type A sorting domain-containing protein [Neolewinella sp.]|uniref:T9SS type A sorting domain-containing protein n=1 Tax=Neolewinella sp. TaxID=2993543 RepID=UPI003B51EE69
MTIFDNAILNTFVRLGGNAPGNGLRTVAGDIRVENNPQLTNLEGFRRLTQGQSLILNSIGLVSDLSGIRSLDTLANFLTITNNPNLSDCCEIACELIVNGQQVDGTNNAVTINNNTGGCEDKPTFVSNCQDQPGKGCLAAAPVEWLAFTGALGSGSIDLVFSTATESDNDYFQIERSVAGGAFVAIGQIDGAGDSQTALSYSFNDYDYSSGLNYYRIRQVDFDGTEAFSDVIVVDAGGSKIALTLFPNPANGSNVTLQLGRDWNADRVTAQIYSVAGQFVREIRATGNSRLFLPTADLQAGMYAVRVSDGNRTVTTRLTIR